MKCFQHATVGEAKLSNTHWKSVIVLAATVWLASFSAISSCSSETSSEVAHLNVYILDLKGVKGHLIGNLSRSVEGALVASSIDTVHFREVALGGEDYYQLVSIMQAEVTDWGQYKGIIETESNVMVVNAHADTVPVPSNYSKVAWVEKIAEAIGYRNLTWVNTGGYPFYYYQSQGENESLWGEDGFKQFMDSMGIANVTCIHSEYRPNLISTDALSALSNWNMEQVFFAEEGYRLNVSDFQGKLLWTIWGFGSPLGAVLKFAGDGMGTSGFYVHVGALRTFNSEMAVTDADYYRSYAGTAAAVYSTVLSFAYEHQSNSPQTFSILNLQSALLLAGVIVTIEASIWVVLKRRRVVAR